MRSGFTKSPSLLYSSSENDMRPDCSSLSFNCAIHRAHKVDVFQVLAVGPTGSGKTLCIGDKLLHHMPKDYLCHFLAFSARTSANQTQDIIDGKLDKRCEYNISPVTTGAKT